MKTKKIFLSALWIGCSVWMLSGQSPYINKVYEFRPAPGQFINELPEYQEGDTEESMRVKAQESISEENKVLVSLGGYGGYITFGFDHPVINVAGQNDFKVWGNAFAAATNPNQEETRFGGSCEPGIVMVSYDANGNGKPDDIWYELAGSEYTKPETIKNYELIYFKPNENKDRTPDNNYPFLNDTTYIRWRSNQGEFGYLYRNTFHDQSYYPAWLDVDSLIFKGTKLADNYVDESGVGNYYVQYAYDWGYVDNFPNNDDRSNLNIEWAVDEKGNPVHLPAIHFVRVYTGVNQYCGWLGETSTEIMGAEDLHPNAELTGLSSPIQQDNLLILLSNTVREHLIIRSDSPQTIQIAAINGQSILTKQIQEGTTHIDCSRMSKGIYLIKTQSQTLKFIKL